ncbi:MAG: hypothetical protein OXG72_02630 [Acidobacteria bacterium]|nr:hypothetical protein [Acidobacteriota bacterium]
MSTILTTTLLCIPILALITYLALYHPRKSMILATEALLYTAPVAAYVALALTLVTPSAPVWLKSLTIASIAGFAILPVPVITSRIIRRLDAAEAAESWRGRGQVRRVTGRHVGLFPVSWQPQRHYFELEAAFLEFAAALDVRASLLDALIWDYMRRLPPIPEPDESASSEATV